MNNIYTLKKEIEKYKRKLNSSDDVIELELIKEKLEKMIYELKNNMENEDIISEIEDLLMEVIVQINFLKKEQSCGYH